MSTVKLVLWKQKKNSSETYPVKIRVNHGNDKRYFAVKLKGHSKNLYLTIQEFNSAMNFRSDLGKKLKSELKRAEDAIPIPFSWIRFNAVYQNKGKSFFVYFEEYLNSIKDDRPGTYNSYLGALNKWKSLSEDFQPIELLSQIERFDNAIPNRATAGAYLRATRALYNRIRLDFPDYPIWNYRINSRTSSHKARTVSIEDLRKFISLKNLSPAQEEARRVFIISFWAAGMNMADILNLKWSDVKDDFIKYRREKTKNTSVEDIQIPLKKELKDLLGRRRNSGYIISNFNRTGTPLEIRNRVKGYIRNMNRRIKIVCQNNGIEPFTTYSARHSFASQLKINGVDTAKISELIGHSSVTTTEYYLRRFDLEAKKEAINTIKLDINED